MSMTGTSGNRRCPGLLLRSIDSSGAPLNRHRVGFVDVDAVPGDRFGDLAALDRAVVGQGLERGTVTQRRSTSKKWRSFARVSERPKPSVPSVT
jgi:hypothetical protein